MASYLDNLNRYDHLTLTRGHDYFKQGLVHDVEIQGGDVRALVSGSEEYDVHLRFDSDKHLLSASCSCPCQFPCKHQVALLYKLDELDSKKQAASTPYSVPELLSLFQESVARRDYASFHQAGISLLVGMGRYEAKDAAELTKSYLSGFASFAYIRSYDFTTLASKLLLALPLTSNEKSALLLELLSNPKLSLQAKKGLFNAFADDPNLATILDAAYLEFAAKNPAESHRILEEAHYHEYQADHLSTGMLLLLMKEDVYIPFSIDIAERLPKLTPTSSKEDIATYSAIVDYLIHEDRINDVPKDALPTLEALGEKDEAGKLARAVFEQVASFDAYLYYRPYLQDNQLVDTFEDLKAEGRLVSCEDAILLYEAGSGKLPLPKWNKITFYDYYRCLDKITPLMLPYALKAVETRFEAMSKLKQPSEEWAYGLLFLDQLGQKDLLKDVLKNPAFESQSYHDDFLRATYLSFLVKEGLLTEKGYQLYPEGKYAAD
jgi:hypothetical protein